MIFPFQLRRNSASKSTQWECLDKVRVLFLFSLVLRLSWSTNSVLCIACLQRVLTHCVTEYIVRVEERKASAEHVMLLRLSRLSSVMQWFTNIIVRIPFWKWLSILISSSCSAFLGLVLDLRRWWSLQPTAGISSPGRNGPRATSGLPLVVWVMSALEHSVLCSPVAATMVVAQCHSTGSVPLKAENPDCLWPVPEKDAWPLESWHGWKYTLSCMDFPWGLPCPKARSLPFC